MKTQTQQFKKTIMWYKVTELNSQGFNKSQISKAVGIDRATVRKYLSMVEVDFIAWISNPKRRPKKLQDYVHYIKTKSIPISMSIGSYQGTFHALSK